MNDEIEQPDSQLDEQLVAYLEGELNAEAAREVEALLAGDEAVRARLQLLDRSWQMLDELDTADAGDEFTRSTMELVVVEAGREAESESFKALWRRWLAWLLTPLALVASLAAGLATVVQFAPDPDRALADARPVLENLDEYRQVDDVALVRLLAEQGVFAEAAEEPPSPLEPVELARRFEQFQRLPAAQRQRIESLHREVAADPRSDELLETMRRYCRFVRTLPAYRRAELLELDRAQRAEQIAKLYQEELRQQARRPGEEDVAGLLRWMERIGEKQESAILAGLPEQRRRQLIELDPAVRRRATMWLAWQRWQMMPPGQQRPISDAELAELRAELTEATRQRMEAMSPAEQRRLVTSWIRQELRFQWSARRPRSPLAPADDEQLAQFFENELTAEERHRLMNLPGDEMHRELQRFYIMRLNLLGPSTLTSPPPAAAPPSPNGKSKRPAGAGPAAGGAAPRETGKPKLLSGDKPSPASSSSSSPGGHAGERPGQPAGAPNGAPPSSGRTTPAPPAAPRPLP